MKSYNGHRSWNAWNVSLWLNNYAPNYEFCKAVLQDMGLEKAATYLASSLKGEKTPDGATYTRIAIHNVLAEWESEYEVE